MIRFIYISRFCFKIQDFIKEIEKDLRYYINFKKYIVSAKFYLEIFKEKIISLFLFKRSIHSIETHEIHVHVTNR